MAEVSVKCRPRDICYSSPPSSGTGGVFSFATPGITASYYVMLTINVVLLFVRTRIEDMSSTDWSLMSIFTFGIGQVHPVSGISLFLHYVEIDTGDARHDRLEMFNRFGERWSFQYNSKEAAGVHEFNLEKLADLPPIANPPKYVLKENNVISIND